MAPSETTGVERLLVVAPNWVGDAVLATPTLRAIRAGLSSARITVLARPMAAEVLAGCPWFDELLSWPVGRSGKPISILAMAGRLRRGCFDTAVLMPNSFRSGLLAFLARVPCRIGYARDGRSVLLTRRIRPSKQGRRFVVELMLMYYARLADVVGCPVSDNRLELFTSEKDRFAVDRLLGSSNGSRPLIVLNPGGSFGPSKYWPAERFGQLADRLVARFGGQVVISGAPAERAIVEQVAGAMRHRAIRLTDSPVRLSAVKELVRRADLLVTNDTGPRHFAVAFGRPVVTLFGSTDPAWTDTGFALERKVRLDLACSPCQEKVCPLGHHDCMRKMTVEMVEEQAVALLSRKAGGRPPADE